MGTDSGGLRTAEVLRTARRFDVLAPRYDQVVESNPIHALLRRRSIAWLDRVFRPGMRVLDIGCGSGTEAIHLASRGVEVVATDASGEMAQITERNVQSHGLSNLVQVECCAARDLGRVFAGTRFDGAYSSFGPLNCEPDLHRAVESCASVLKPGGSFVASIVSRPCIWEIAMGMAMLKFRKGFRRQRDEGVRIRLYDSGDVWARAYSESEVRHVLRPWFEIGRIEGWLVAVPPPYLAATWERLGAVRKPLERLDAVLGNAWPIRGWGDHLHVWARRRVT